MKSLSAIVAALLLGSLGCTLPRGVIAAGGETGLPDASGFDGGPDHDADVDAFRADTGLEEDVGVDVGVDPPDVGTDAGCVPSAEACNGRDDDCNGAVDDGTVCSACTSPGSCNDCIRFEAGGRVYQSCPPVSPYEYWARLCWTLGDGYDLAALETAGERDAVRAALDLEADLGTHWIGLMDRETNGTYRWVDGAALTWSPVFSDTFAPRSNEPFVTLNDDGRFDDWPAGFDQRALCELGPPRCTSRTADDVTCDGRDDDCDGFVDEDCDGPAACTSRVFDRSVYYRCSDDLDSIEAEQACVAARTQLASLTDRFELAVLADYLGGDAWVGLAQAVGGAESDGGWAWADGTAFPASDPDWSSMWDGSEPAGGAGEQCAFLDDGTDRLHDGVCANNRTETLCERPIVP